MKHPGRNTHTIKNDLTLQVGFRQSENPISGLPRVQIISIGLSKKSRQKTPWAMDIQSVSTVP